MTIPSNLVDDVLIGIFETMYFCELRSCGSGRVPPPATGGAVRFSGHLNGEFRLLISQPLADRLAADFLAEKPTAEQTEAVIRELANIACGAIMGALFPECNLGFAVPTDLRMDSPGKPFEHCFAVSEYRAAFEIKLESAALKP
jgi:hypothetical protein